MENRKNMNLEFKKAVDFPRMAAPAVLAAIRQLPEKDQIFAAEINPAWADGDLLSKNYGIPEEMEANCLIVDGSRGEHHTYAALVVPYGKRANTNAVVRRPLNAKKVVFADAQYVIQETGMEPGSITPIGLPEGWKILVDPSVFEHEEIIIGSGLLNSKIRMPSAVLKKLPGSEVIEGLAKE